jgi:hypothetical protein
MKAAGWFAVVCVAGIAACALWPLSPALSSTEVLQQRIACAALTVVACTAVALTRRIAARMWLSLALLSAVIAAVMLWMHFSAERTCVADYNGRPTVIGGDFTPLGLEYVNKNPGVSNDDLLLDAGGNATRVWTPESVNACRFRLSWVALLPVPFLATCLCALIAQRQFRGTFAARPAAPKPSADAPRVPVYDVFLSYRHTDPDRDHATELLRDLESKGLRVAIDVRDFAPNEHFLSEMERCIKESRFVLCVVTPQYVDSDHCSEEAIISKTLDMAERRKRLVPLIFERVELPVWMHGLVGIDFTDAASVDPIQRLLGLVQSK